MKRQAKSRRGTLFKKLVRDLWGNGMQFLAMLLLCALGTWVFSGLDASWRMQECTFETYLSGQKLADFWIKASSFSNHDIHRIERLSGIADAQARISVLAEAPKLEGKVSVLIHGFDGQTRINLPVLRQGEMLNDGDSRGCLAEEQFARAQGLGPGDVLEIRIGTETWPLTIRGTVLSPEHLITAKDTAPTPETYGFVLVNSTALPGFLWNEVVVKAKTEADHTQLEEEIRETVPEALIISQRTHQATSTARNYTDMFRNLSYLFPVLAYFVAALVVITTLKRFMIMQRIQIGTLKSLGYSNARIRRHYIWFALVPSLTGSLAGLFLGQYTIPDIIWRMVATNIRVPEVLRASISLPSWIMAGLEPLACLALCVFHINRVMEESTAELLRPKPPKSGVRILLERFPPLWRRFSFNSKMIVRNLMRNKGRTLMSMVGMLFCNMLIICSFGLQDSIPHFTQEYFFGTLAYDMRVDLDASQAGTLDSYRARLRAEQIDGIMENSVSLRTGKNTRTTLLTILPDDIGTIRLNKNQTVKKMPDTGIVLTEKLAELLETGIGDTLEVWLTGDDEPLRLKVADLADSNVGQSAYMSKSAWKKCRKDDFWVTALLLKNPTAETINRINQMDEMDTIKYPKEQYKQTLRIMDSARGAFSLLSGVALGLAFVICYNMGLMNFNERTRDYATLKVLGYHQREIRRLMLRENNLTAVFGTASGIIPGIMLIRIILKMCEYDSMVFEAYVTPGAVVLACAITFAFAWFIEWLLTRKVRGIDMVEALKSVE